MKHVKRGKVRTKQLVERIAKETDIDENVVREVLNTLGPVVGACMRQGKLVRIDGFGEFNNYKRVQKPQQVTSLQGEQRMVAAQTTNVVAFSQSRGLKELLRCPLKKVQKKK